MIHQAFALHASVEAEENHWAGIQFIEKGVGIASLVDMSPSWISGFFRDEVKMAALSGFFQRGEPPCLCAVARKGIFYRHDRCPYRRDMDRIGMVGKRGWGVLLPQPAVWR